MEYVIKFIYSFVLPPGLFISLLIGVTLLFIHQHNKAWRWTAGLGLLMYVFSLPVTGILLIHPLEGMYTPPAHPHGDVIVMLGGGATLGTPDMNGRGQLSGDAANRLLTTYRLYRATHLPILLSGGKVFPDSGVESEIGRRQLLALGVPRSKLWIENKSITTRTNAIDSQKILRAHHVSHPILVTSAFHMPRAVRNFRQAGIHVVPYPTDYLVSRQLMLYPEQFVPSSGAVAYTALKEYIGLLASLL
ncbi:MAG: YdcF family protein [Sporolactobacillus sp.]